MGPKPTPSPSLCGGLAIPVHRALPSEVTGSGSRSERTAFEPLAVLTLPFGLQNCDNLPFRKLGRDPASTDAQSYPAKGLP